MVSCIAFCRHLLFITSIYHSWNWIHFHTNKSYADKLSAISLSHQSGQPALEGMIMRRWGSLNLTRNVPLFLPTLLCPVILFCWQPGSKLLGECGSALTCWRRKEFAARADQSSQTRLVTWLTDYEGRWKRSWNENGVGYGKLVVVSGKFLINGFMLGINWYEFLYCTVL